jgi:hypothetical protein
MNMSMHLSLIITTALTAAIMLLAVSSASAASAVVIYPAPPDEEMSPDYTVSIDGRAVPVYAAKVAPADTTRRWKAMDDKKNSADYFEKAAFCYFDMAGPVRITVTSARPVESAVILPGSFNVKPVVNGNTVTIDLSQPRHLTLEINGDYVNSLHLFANPPEKDAPSPDDPNVIYFGPGIHEITHMEVGSGKTVYVAGGAVVRGVIGPDEKFGISSYSGLRTYTPTLVLKGSNITLRGRGIIDGSRSTTHARNLVVVDGQDIRLEGVILRDSSTWTIPVRRSDRVHISNVKLIGYRANSDGIDVCNSRDVTIEDCFIRTLDDLIVVKTFKDQGPAQRIVARRCVLWNEVAHALSIGAELRENVDDVLFEDCDVIRDKGREWVLRVYHCDSARISNVRFENIRVEESRRFMSLWIGQASWSRDAERGTIRDITFRNISLRGKPVIEFRGFDREHDIAGVLIENVTVDGRPLTAGEVRSNEFVSQVVVRP